jgi:hypothetical protein
MPTHRPVGFNAGTRAVAAMVISVALVATPLQMSRAGSSNGVKIGIGVVGGLLLLDELSKSSKTKSKRSTASGSKSQTTTRKAVTATEKTQPATPQPVIKPGEAVARQSGPAAAATLPVTASVPPNANSLTAVISTPDEIRSAQQHLSYMGYNVPEANGVLDARTKGAVMLFQESIGAPVTGDLTQSQLLLLFGKVAQKDAPAQ